MHNIIIFIYLQFVFSIIFRSVSKTLSLHIQCCRLTLTYIVFSSPRSVRHNIIIIIIISELSTEQTTAAPIRLYEAIKNWKTF